MTVKVAHVWTVESHCQGAGKEDGDAKPSNGANAENCASAICTTACAEIALIEEER